MVTAAEVLLEEYGRTYEGVLRTLLAQVPPGSDVVILADGTLARLESVNAGHYRLVPLTGEP